MKLKMKRNWILTLMVSTLFFSFSAKAQVKIGDQINPKDYSLLELTSNTTRGLRLPHLTTVQRDLISTKWRVDPEAIKLEGLVIYNINNDCLEYWNGSSWISFCENNVIKERSEKPLIYRNSYDLLYWSTGCPDSAPYSGFCNGILAASYVYGAGVPGAKITVIWCDGTTDETTVVSIASCNESWVVYDRLNRNTSPCWLRGAEVKIIQTEPGKLPSEPVVLTIDDQYYCRVNV